MHGDCRYMLRLPSPESKDSFGVSGDGDDGAGNRGRAWGVLVSGSDAIFSTVSSTQEQHSAVARGRTRGTPSRSLGKTAHLPAKLPKKR